MIPLSHQRGKEVAELWTKSHQIKERRVFQRGTWLTPSPTAYSHLGPTRFGPSLPQAPPPPTHQLSAREGSLLGTVDLEPGTNPRVFMERPQVQACRAGLNHRSRSRLEALVLWLCQSPFQIVSLWMLHVFCHQSHSYKTGILHTRFSWGNCSEFICIPQLSWQRDLLPLFSQAEVDSWLGGRGWSSPFLLLHSWLLQKCISALPCSVMFLKISQECKQKSLFFDVGCLNVRSGKGLHSQATTELWPVV